MKKILAALTIFMGMTSVAYADGDAAAGKEKAMVCGGCHGADGNSMVANFPKLAGQGQKYLIKQMKDIKSGARKVPEMTGLLDALGDQDFADIAAYYSSQKAKPGVAKDKMIKKGEQTFRAGNLATGLAACAGCHGPDGKGMETAGFPRLAGQHADYTAKQLKDFRKGDRSNDGDARMMRTVAAKLSDTEIEAVSNYIQGLR